MKNGSNKRDAWATKTGLILAMAGNAIGLGNFLRFPTQAAENGGGAFMIPYFIAFILIGIPIMWMEWGMGRYGGSRGHGTTPAIFNLFWKSPISRTLGVIGLWIPLVVTIYYVYIESWTLGYALHFLLGSNPSLDPGSVSNATEYVKPYSNFLANYLGVGDGVFLSPSKMAITAFVITIAANFYIMLRGISGGIEIFVKYALPMLFVLAIILVVKTLTLKTDYGTAVEGLNFLWNPDFEALKNPKVWIAAAGQIFFTLSLAFGAIVAYASYIKIDDDVTLSGLTSATLNETVEVVLGGSIAIPAAVAFFGVASVVTVAQSGAFSLGFVSLPAVFSSISGSLGGVEAGRIFGFLWFFLLFFAGMTSSVAIAYPVVTFLQDEFNISRQRAVVYTMLIIIVSVLPVILVSQVLDEWDFWAGTIMLVVFGFIEIVMFMWVFGADRAWNEINSGGFIQAPRVFYYILKYLTPFFLLILVSWWGYSSLPSVIGETSWNIWFARFYIVGLFVFLSVMVYIAGSRKR